MYNIHDVKSSTRVFKGWVTAPNAKTTETYRLSKAFRQSRNTVGAEIKTLCSAIQLQRQACHFYETTPHIIRKPRVAITRTSRVMTWGKPGDAVTSQAMTRFLEVQ